MKESENPRVLSSGGAINSLLRWQHVGQLCKIWYVLYSSPRLQLGLKASRSHRIQVNNLNILSRRVSSWPSQTPYTANEFPTNDKRLLWDLLTYASDGNNIGQNGRVFHSSLDPSVVFKPVHSSKINSGTTLTAADEAAIPYIADSGNRLQNILGSSEFSDSQASPSVLLDNSETVALNGDFNINDQASTYTGHNTNYGFGLYEWSGTGNL
jgi:hypothetical protein